MADTNDPDGAVVQTVHHCCSLAHHAKSLQPDDIEGHREIVRLLILTTDALMKALGVSWDDRLRAISAIKSDIQSVQAALVANEELLSEAESQLEQAISQAEDLLKRLEASGSLPEWYWQVKSQMNRPH